MVPGIGFSLDILLQGRLFSYGDAQRYLIGVNYNYQILVNRAKVAVHDYHRDGMMQVSGAAYAFDPTQDPTDDCFRAGGNLWWILAEDKKQLLIENPARNIEPCTENIKYSM